VTYSLGPMSLPFAILSRSVMARVPRAVVIPASRSLSAWKDIRSYMGPSSRYFCVVVKLIPLYGSSWRCV
jgi:hypothetical protein